jgi:hypothetical protein
MALPRDWAFNAEHTDLDAGGRLNTGEGTLLDWAATVALTSPGQLPSDPSFGAGLSDALGNPASAREAGERLRGFLCQDDRVEDVSTQGTTEAGKLTLPVQITAADGSYRLSGPLTVDLIEAIIEDRGL